MDASSSLTTTKTHRACDECRSRKLKCVKDGTSCTRCRQESIECVFSEQKQMGRPRKRQFIEAESQDHTQAPVEQVTVQQTQPEVPIDPMLENTMDILNQESLTEDPISSRLLGYVSGTKGPAPHDGSTAWQFGFGSQMFADQINFGDSSASEGPSENDSSPSSNQDTSASASDHASGLSHSYEHGNLDTAQCTCLAEIYLSLASLQELPGDINGALKTVRGAAATARKVLHCPICGDCPINDDFTVPIRTFQNGMLLGTIIPTIAYGYKRLLQMVDCETSTAATLGQKKVFRMGDYWSSNAQLCLTDCDLSHLKHVEMEPAEWRTTMRALLRADVYGHDGLGEGINGLILEMERKSRSRHALLDVIASKGLLSNESYCVGEKDRTCIRILDAAKRAVNDLVIA